MKRLLETKRLIDILDIHPDIALETLQRARVDYKGISRAAVSYVVHKGRITQGGSTLTQQLAKTVFLNRQKTWKRKVKEIFMAVEL